MAVRKRKVTPPGPATRHRARAGGSACRQRCSKTSSKPEETRRCVQSGYAIQKPFPCILRSSEENVACCSVSGSRVERPGCPPPPPKFGLGVKRPTSRLRPACPCLWRRAAFRKSWRGDIALCTSWLSLAHPISSRITAEHHGSNRKEHIGYGLARRFPDPVRGGAVQPVRSPRRSLLCS